MATIPWYGTRQAWGQSRDFRIVSGGALEQCRVSLTPGEQRPSHSAEDERDHQHPDVSPSVMMLQKSPKDQQATPEVREKEEREQKCLKLVSFKLG